MDNPAHSHAVRGRHFGYIHELFGMSDQDIGDVITCIIKICILSRLLKAQRSLLSVIKNTDIFLFQHKEI